MLLNIICIVFKLRHDEYCLDWFYILLATSLNIEFVLKKQKEKQTYNSDCFLFELYDSETTSTALMKSINCFMLCLNTLYI